MNVGEIFNPHGLFVGSFLPNALLRYQGVSATAKLLWARLAQYAGRKGTCFPKQSRLADDLGMSCRNVMRIINELKRAGFIRTQKPTGKDRLMHKTNVYVFVWHSIFDTTTEATFNTCGRDNFVTCEHEQRCRSQGASNVVSNRRESYRRKTLSPKVERVTHTHPRWVRMSHRLHDAIRRIRNVDHSRQLTAWAKAIASLHRIEKIDIARIRDVLDWYCGVIDSGDPYLPVAHSGAAFREKFLRIEAARERRAKQGGTRIHEQPKASRIRTKKATRKELGRVLGEGA